MYTGVDPEFSGRATDYVRSRTSRARSPNSLTAGVQGPPKCPGNSWPLGVFDALSCYMYLSLIFKHSDTKWDFKKNSRLNFRGGGTHSVAPPPPPLNPPLCIWYQYICFQNKLWVNIHQISKAIRLEDTVTEPWFKKLWLQYHFLAFTIILSFQTQDNVNIIIIRAYLWL